MGFQKFISKNFLVQNCLAAASVGISLFFLVKIFEVPVLPVSEIIVMKGLCSLTALLGIAASIYLIFQERIQGYQKGFCFNIFAGSVLLSYAIAWHLNAPYFNYEKLVEFIPVIIIAGLQGLIWVRADHAPEADNDSNSSGGKWLVTAAIFGVIFFVVAVIVSIRTVRFEDTFITFRYGWNLANGHGINWNITDPVPSEGYTTFTFVILSAFFYAINIDPLAGVIVLSLVSMGVLAYFVWDSGRMVFLDKKG